MRTEAVDGTPRHLCLISHGCRRNDGQSRVNYEIIVAALDRGWRVTFIGSSLAPDLQARPSLNWLRVPRARIPSNLLKNLVFAARASLLVKKHRRAFDIIHTNGFIVWGEASINSVHFVHSGWLKDKFYPYDPRKSRYALYQYSFTRLNAYLERTAFRASRELIAVSAKVRDEVLAIGIPPSRVSVIYNGVDPQEFHPGPPERARFRLPEVPRLFLFAGDIRSQRKNIESVIHALASVPDVHLAVAGALEKSPYPRLAQSLGVGDRVHFLGLVVDMPALMRSVDAFIFPSRYEPFGLVLLEAMASGLPVITAQTAGGAEVVGEGGLVVTNPDDIPQLAAAMRQLDQDSGTRAIMAGKARQVACDLSWSHMTEQYFAAYERCL